MVTRLVVMLAVCAPAVALSVTAAKAANRLKEALAACALISHAGDRLLCYDALAADLGLRKERLTAGSWSIDSKVDPLDDSEVMSASNLGTASKQTLRGAPVLILRAQKGRTEAFISWGEYLGDSAPTNVKVVVACSPRSCSDGLHLLC
jgi:hypothetical protein